MSTPNPVQRLAQILHSQFCMSTSWETPKSAAEHTRRCWVPRASTILEAANPAVEFHDTVACDAVADPTFPNGCGPDYDRHIQFLQDWLDRNGFTDSSPAAATASPNNDSTTGQATIPGLDSATLITTGP